MIDRHELPHPREEERIEALRRLQILDTPIEDRFERITRLAGKSLDMPICAISCIDLHRQWFKSIQGLEISQTTRGESFCQHTILSDEVIVIPDARFDDRFANNPLVTGDPGIVFYAGAPIFSRANLPVATLCVIDREPRSFSVDEREMLREFARIAERELHAPRANEVERALIQQVGEVWRSSMIDPLTSAWNHEGIALIITESVRRQGLSGHRPVAVATIELCGYQQVCKKLGFVQGDAYMRRFSREALKLLGHAGSIGHLRDAEFALVLPDLDSRNDFQDTLRRILDMASREMPFESETEAIGFGFWIDHCNSINPDLLLEQLCDGLDAVRYSAQDPLKITSMGSSPADQSAA